MKLITDFHQLYDRHFDGIGKDFVRLAKGSGPDKPEQFRILKEAGFVIPTIGLVGDVMGEWWESEKCWIKYVVAYDDVNAHCASGKRVFSNMHVKSSPDMGAPGGDRYWKENAMFCSAFVGPYPQVVSGGAKSLRLLQIGEWQVWLEYTSTESWMSNFGEGDCVVYQPPQKVERNPMIPYPLYAIDFVIGREMYAIDLNIAPGIPNSIINQIGGKEVVSQIERTACLATRSG